MKEGEFIKLNFKFEISNFCANVKVKITSLRTAVRQLVNTLTVREFKKRIIRVCMYEYYRKNLILYTTIKFNYLLERN
jgi:hypothetical protein